MSLYSRTQIDFVMNQKKQGKSYEEIIVSYGKKFGEKKTKDSLEHLFRKHKHDYDFATLKSTVEIKTEILRDAILKAVANMIAELQYVPTMIRFTEAQKEITRDQIRHHFRDYDQLIEETERAYPEVFERIIDDRSFTEENFQELQKYIAKHNRFVITTAVTGCEPSEDALDAIEAYCKHNGAALLILPCSDPAKQKDHKSRWSLSQKLPRSKVVFRDLFLNKNLMLSTIKMSAKQLQPLTGLKRISQKNGSAVFASPKQFLEFATNSNNNSDIPRALMTTGAVTTANYNTEMYMSERTGYLADQDHTMGAVVVEVRDSKIFFFRHVQFAKDGSFCDLNKKYNPSGKVEKITAELVQLGDYHVMSTDPHAKRMAREIVELVKPDILTLEDFFDGITINPHERKNFVALSKKAKVGLLNLDTELRANREEISELMQWPVKSLIFKYGNHEDFLRRWIADGAFMNEPQNKILGMKLNIAMEENGEMPFEFAMRQVYGLGHVEKIRFLSLNESFKVNGVENAAHGHLGKAGRRNPNLAEIEECFGAANVGHNHSAGIFRSVYRVGTSTKLQLSYNDGPSAWTQTHLIQHRDGSRQLIHLIGNDWSLKSK